MDLDLLKEAVDFMNANGLCELTWERGEEKISLKTSAAFSGGGSPMITFNPQSHGQISQPQQQPQYIDSKATEAPKNQLQICSPFVGTFYKSPAPGSDAYVAEGKAVKPGDVLCIVEAMKLMNEIESEVSGRIVKILAEDGQPVEYGEPLFIYEK